MAQDFLQVYKENVAAVYAFLAYRAVNPEQADDLTQATFERALRAWPRFDPSRASAKTWLLSIARNALIDEVRKTRGEEQSLESPAGQRAAAEQGDPGPEASLPGVRPELADALRRLRPAQREILALRFGADLTSAEIAGILDQSVANIHQLTSRALRKLRQELEGRIEVGPGT
jgi:RNA polymerase sigma factor (sigma-70 family)